MPLNRAMSYTDRLNISVIELDFHHDSLDGFLKIFDDTIHRVNVFTTKKNIRILSNVPYSNNITFHEFSGGSKYLFLKKHKNIINNSHITFINTIANDYGGYLSLENKSALVLRVHNANKQFAPLKNIFCPSSLFQLWKFVSYVGRQIIGKGFLVYRPLVNKKIDYFTFPDSNIYNHALSQHFVEKRKTIPPIPLKIYNEKDTAFIEYTQQLNITIIGATDKRRRDYAQAIEAFTLLSNMHPSCKINLTLLGNSNNLYGKEVLTGFKNISHPNFTLKTYSTQVKETDFIQCIKETHIIISPITSEATTDIFKEEYGKTKTTGSILDFMKFGKTTLVPTHYSPPDEMKNYILKYATGKELCELIIGLTKGNKINKLNMDSLAYVQANYSKEIVLERATTIFKSILKDSNK